MSDNQGVPTLPPLVGGGSNNGGNSSNTSGTQQTVNLQQVLATQGLNVLTTGAGQQFVITSQVPGLTQVIKLNIFRFIIKFISTINDDFIPFLKD